MTLDNIIQELQRKTGLVLNMFKEFKFVSFSVNDSNGKTRNPYRTGFFYFLIDEESKLVFLIPEEIGRSLGYQGDDYNLITDSQFIKEPSFFSFSDMVKRSLNQYIDFLLYIEAPETTPIFVSQLHSLSLAIDTLETLGIIGDEVVMVEDILIDILNEVGEEKKQIIQEFSDNIEDISESEGVSVSSVFDIKNDTDHNYQPFDKLDDGETIDLETILSRWTDLTKKMTGDASNNQLELDETEKDDNVSDGDAGDEEKEN